MAIRPADLDKIKNTRLVGFLPYNSTLLHMDNSSRSELIDTVPITELGYLSDQRSASSIRKFICLPKPQEFLHDSEELPFDLSKVKGTYNTSGMATSLQEYRRSTVDPLHYRVLSSPIDIQTGPQSFNIIGFNHLFRMKFTGNMRVVKHMEYILACMINSLVLTPISKGKFFINIELSNKSYTIDKFSQAAMRMDTSTIKYPLDYNYIFLMHYLSWLNPKGRTSMFDHIPEHLVDRVNFIFTKGEYFTIHNKLDLEEMRLGDRLPTRVLEQLNLLSSQGLLAEPVTDVKDAPIDDIPVAESNPVAIEADTKPRIKNGKRLKNETHVTAISDPKIIEKMDKEFVSNNEEETEAYIENSDIPERLKERARRYAAKYKDPSMQIDGVSVKDIIEGSADVTVDDNKLDFLEENLVDKSMASSSVCQFDKSYLAKTYKKDILNSLISFQKHGMFIDNIEKKIESNEVNSIETWKVTFIDIHGKKHTSNIMIPHIDKDGYYLSNGSKKFFKKQMVNIPICKVSSMRVALASSYNKALVERNQSVAHKFLPYVERLIKKLNKDEEKVSLSYGNLTYKNTMPYELTAIAGRFEKLTLNYGSKKLVINFDNSDFIGGPDREVVEFMTDDEIAKYREALQSQPVEIKIHQGNTFKEQPKKGDILWTQIGFPVEVVTVKGSLDKGDMVIKVKTSKQEEYTLKDYARCCELASSLVAISKFDNHVIMIDFNGKLHYTDKGKCVETDHALLDLICSVNDPVAPRTIDDVLGDVFHQSPVNHLTEWVDLTILSNKVPLIFALGLKFGLTNMLEYMGVDYRIYDKAVPRKELSASDIVIRFKDKSLVMNRAPLTHSLIFAGLGGMYTKNFEMEMFDSKEVYSEILALKGKSPNYTLGILSFFDLFMDYMTVDRLKQMGEPTNVRDLLIRATVMLSTEDYSPAASMKNFCVRSYERVPALIYQEFARKLHEYQNTKTAVKTFTINPQAVYQKIISDAASDMVSDTCNPVHSVKELSSVTYTGLGGRTSESFTQKDRIYPEDGIGILSTDTVDSGKVALVSYMANDPCIENTRGMFNPKDLKDTKPGNALSAQALLMPAVNRDDQQ
jgi:hypothetical protein